MLLHNWSQELRFQSDPCGGDAAPRQASDQKAHEVHRLAGDLDLDPLGERWRLGCKMMFSPFSVDNLGLILMLCILVLVSFTQ